MINITINFSGDFAESRSVSALSSLMAETENLRIRLRHHPIYQSIQSLDDVRSFMESHIFAVWDFMSLLKALQRELTCVSVPWVPNGNAKVRRFINEIVMEEESDVSRDGDSDYASHFELYRRAMIDIGADIGPIDRFIRLISSGMTVQDALIGAGAPSGARAFVNTTWSMVETRSGPVVGAAFAFGREGPIPEMFRALIAQLGERYRHQLGGLIFYLERHVELDGDHHGPMANQMINELCGDDGKKWDQARRAATQSLTARIQLWDSVLDGISSTVVSKTA